MHNNRIIITGALGQDGRILSKKLVSFKYKVFGFIKPKNNKPKIKKVIYKKIDLQNKKKLLDLIKNINPSTIVHFGSDNPSYLDLKTKDFLTNNILSTKNLIDAIIKTNLKINFIFANTSQIYLNKKNKIINESSKISTPNIYTKFRVKIINYLKEKKKNKNFKYSNLILFNHDSIFRNKKFLLPRLTKAIINNNEKFINEIYESNIQGDFSHAEDICNAIYLLIKKEINFDNLILSSSKKTKINSIINHLIKKYNKSIKITKKPKKNKFYLIGNNKLAKKKLNWKIKKNIFIAADEIFNNNKKNSL